MDLSCNLFSSQGDTTTLESNNNGLSKASTKNPFLDSFSDPFRKLNLKETSDFVRSFPGVLTETSGISVISAQNGVGKRNFSEAPPTPGRPVFSFSSTNYSRKCFPSKWDDAEKWLASGTDSPSNNNHNSKMYSKQCSGYKPHMGSEVFAEKSRITEEKVSKLISTAFHGPPVMDHQHTSARAISGVVLSAPPDVLLLKDKFPNELNLKNSQPMQEGFLFGNTIEKSVPQHRDMGTEMTPLGSSTTSRCPTPFKSTSPARHNTPANRSGPLGPYGPEDHNIDLQDFHLAKLAQSGSMTSNWSSREEEEEDVSKSLRHFEMTRKSVSEPKLANYCVWEQEDKTKTCLRYQREEAKIEAWVNLQSAKAEAESRKLEVKVQRMRASLEEKLMKRMADVHRKAEEWRATAQFQHSEQIRKAGQQAREAMTKRNNKISHLSSSLGHKTCGCFPCNKY